MGRIKWRVQEWLYLEELAQSEDGKALLERDVHNWWKDAVRWFVAKYKEKFDYCFAAETTEDFQIRRKLQPRATQQLHPAETENDQNVRIGGISERIGNYVKTKSPNRQRNKSSKSRKSKSPSVAPVSVVDMMAKSSSTPLAPATTGFQLFLASDHPSRPLTVYKTLPDREVFESEARKLNAARHMVKETSPQDRNAKLAEFLPFFKKTYEAMANEVGWVGWFPVGGIDEHGKIVAIHDGTAARLQETYEEYLAKRIGWSVGRLRTVFDDFLRDMFDPPRAASEPMLEVPHTIQSPSSQQGASGGTPSPEHPPVATTSSSSAPTTPQSISTSAAWASLDVHSPTAHPAVSPAPSPRAVPQLLLPIPDNHAQTVQPSDVTKSAVSDYASPHDTPRKEHPTPLSSTPSSLRPSDVATPVETPSKPPPVRFGSAPDRVLTTAPPKRKASQRRRGPKPRKQERAKPQAA
ncbi:hypothetical protein LXA43DRAFT_1100757 [Ganoderma leucocontextum]|nr:hypothetical protein LXA43DRAFT_1100757 [Ganoderma leucocontextum]